MFGGLYPDGQTGGAQLLSDLTLEKIDYDWIEAQTKPNFLKKAIKLIEEDGNYFVELKEACIKKLIKLDPTKAPKVFNNNIDESDKRQLQQEILNWEKEQSQKEEQKIKAQKIFEIEDPLQANQTELTIEQKKQKAENEKNKGNEALKSKDFKEAIEYYTKSIEYDPKLAASYCNRALVYLKLKEYEKVIKDCNLAIQIDPNYIKAYHRRGKARFAQEKVYEAYCDFKFIMEKEPDNTEVNGDLKECQDLLKKSNTNPEKGFKRVQIVEEDDDDEENDNEEKSEQNNGVSSLDIQKRQFYDSQINEIEVQKEEANKMIKDKGLYEQASEVLKTCVGRIDSLGPFSSSQEDQNEFMKKKANYLNNISLCYKQVDDNKNVILYSTQVILMKNALAPEVLAKAYLRRAMAYERLEKYKRSMKDFLKVKHIEPGNLSSSQGMRRVQQCVQYDKEVLSDSEAEEDNNISSSNKLQVEEEEEIILVKKSNKSEDSQKQQTKLSKEEDIQKNIKNTDKKTDKLEQLTQMKEQGNTLFTSKDIEGALKKFREICLEIEVNYSQRLNNKKETHPVQQLYLQVLGNQSLCLLNLKRYDEVIKSTTSALYYQEDNIKCLYRRAQAYKAIAHSITQQQSTTTDSTDNINNLKLQYENYEKARKDLEKVNQLDTSNAAAKSLLQEVSKLSIEVKLALRHLENEKLNQKNQQNQTSEQSKSETSTKKDTETSQITSNLTAEDLHKITEQALQTATDNLVNDFKLPENSTTFEKVYNQLKNQNEKFYAYIKQIPSEHYSKIYDKNDLPSNILLHIITVLTEFGVKDDKEVCQKIIRGLTKTCKFNLCVKFITKKEKKDIKDLLDSIGLGDAKDLLDIFKL